MRIFVAVFFFWSSSIHALVPEDIKVKNPNTKTPTELIFVGASVHQRLSKPIYFASLYSANKSSIFSTDNAMAMELRIISNSLSHDTLGRIWQEMIAINNNSDSATEQDQKINSVEQNQEINTFVDLLKKQPIKDNNKFIPGDQIRFLYLPGTGTTITLNGAKLGFFPKDTLFPLLLQTWTGSVPPSSDFKLEIVGNYTQTGSDTDKLFADYNALQPSKDRIIEVTQAIDAMRRVAKTTQTARTQPRVTQNDTDKPPAPATNEQDRSAPHISESENPASGVLQSANTVAVLPKVAVPIVDEDSRREREEQAERQSKLRQQQQEKLETFIKQFQTYPRLAIKKGISGTTLFTVTSYRNGYFNFTLKQSSDSGILDSAAVEALETAKEKVDEYREQLEFPTELEANSFSFQLAMIYVLK